jgi:hypothetical protein
MRIRCGFACLTLSILCAGVAYAQSEAKVDLLSGTANAGDSIEAKLTLDSPAPCDASVWLGFGPSHPEAGSEGPFNLGGEIKKGETTVTVRMDIPRDFQGGDFVSAGGSLLPCPGYQNRHFFRAPKRTLSIRPLPDQTQYPAVANVELLLTQKQFLEAKVAELDDLDNQLNTGLEKNYTEGSRRALLTEIASKAEDALDATEIQYRQVMKLSDKTPAFFADFRARYKELLFNLYNQQPSAASAENRLGAILLRVQLKERAPSEQPPSGWSPDASALWQTIKDNISAFRIIEKSGRITFSASLTSYPTGARVFYRKAIDSEYQDYSSLTNVQNATFDLSRWFFKFHKDGCTDELECPVFYVPVLLRETGHKGADDGEGQEAYC